MSEPVRLAMVGAGWWAWTAHLPSMRDDPGIELATVCDPDPTRAHQAAAEFGGEASTDLAATLRDDTLDGVVVATPHHTHASVVAAALAAGRHVLVEKPMVLRAVDAWELVETARARSLHLSVGLTYQYADVALPIRDAVQHEIGELVCVNADFPSGTAALFARTDPDQDHLDDPASPHGTTFSNPATGGGQAYSQLTHLLGAVCFAAQDQAVDVAAMTADHGFAVDAVDALVFRLSRGALGVASSTATTPTGVEPGQPIRFHGTAGMVEWELTTGTGTIRTASGVR
ncbi:MAG: Gfo/Idh/MocA family oxidoreductase, partial [Propionibacteriaceae bacterium]